jgi:hypothetical protein
MAKTTTKAIIQQPTHSGANDNVTAEMRASQEERVGASGVSDVMSNLQRIGWGPVENTRHDLGTDVFSQVRDERRFDLGLFVGFQIKSGAGWFSREERDNNGGVVGWWFYESEPKHFEYWTSHTLPHFLVLNDETTRVSYWAHVTPECLVSTGKGMRVLVPSNQRIDIDNLAELIKAASSQRKSYDLSGSAWRAGVGSITPGRRLRYALLAPRLIAPHVNAGYDRLVEAEEAIALIASGRFVDYHRHSERNSKVPSAEGAANHKEWRWRFFSVLWSLSTADDASEPALRRLRIETAPGSSERAAATVLLAAQLGEAEKHDSAIWLTRNELADDRLAPADQAWISVHLANSLLETGEVEEARLVALGVLASVAGPSEDITLAPLQASASWIVFSTADIRQSSANQADLLTVVDNPAAWWRQQNAGYGLANALIKNFRIAVEDTTERWSSEDLARSRLWSASFIAQMAGDYGAYRSHLRQLGTYELSQGISGETGTIDSGLRNLRASGDLEALKLSIQYLWSHGPSEFLETFGSATTPPSWSHTLARIDLGIWQYAGDCMPEEAADSAVESCLGILNDSAYFIARVQPTFLVEHAVIESLTGLVRAASPDVRLRVVRHISSLRDQGDGLTAHMYARLAAKLHSYPPVERSSVAEALTEAAARQTDNRLSAALSELAGTDAAKTRLVQRASDGDDYAIEALGDITLLTVEAARAAIARNASRVREIVAQAAQFSWGFGGMDAGYTLTVLNKNWPADADWEPVHQLLLTPLVSGNDKRGIAEYLTRFYDELPFAVQNRLYTDADGLATQPEMRHHAFDRGLGAALIALALRSGGLTGVRAAEVTSQALAEGSQSRRDFVGSLIDLGHTEGALPLVISLGDRDPQLRREAAEGLTRLAALAPPDELTLAALRRAIEDSGALVPMTVAANLRREADGGASWPTPLLAACETHRSATVRLAARVGHTV